jgi:CheY-like chemotaxis protein
MPLSRPTNERSNRAHEEETVLEPTDQAGSHLTRLFEGLGSTLLYVAGGITILLAIVRKVLTINREALADLEKKVDRLNTELAASVAENAKLRERVETLEDGYRGARKELADMRDTLQAAVATFLTERPDVLANKYLILCDDQVSVRNVLALFAQECGMTVETCGTFKEAVSLIARRRPDILVTDIELGTGKRTGTDLCKHVKETLRATIPVAAVTGYDADDDIAAYYGAGFDDVLVKPVGGNEFVARLAALLSDVR